MEQKLTSEQVENWRRVLTAKMGPYASLMTDEQIQRARNMMQNAIDTPGAEEDKIKDLLQNSKAVLCYFKNTRQWSCIYKDGGYNRGVSVSAKYATELIRTGIVIRNHETNLVNTYVRKSTNGEE